jgi:hypothetical protein
MDTLTETIPAHRFDFCTNRKIERAATVAPRLGETLSIGQGRPIRVPAQGLAPGLDQRAIPGSWFAAQGGPTNGS